MSSPFKQPGQGGDRFDLKANGDQWLGALMLVYPDEVIVGFDGGEFEPTDVVRGDVILIDRTGPDGQPLKFQNTMLFSKGLVSNTRNDVGGMVLGRLVKKQFRMGTGWSMDPFSDQDAQAAQAYILANPRQAPSQPAPQQQAPPTPPPAPDPWSMGPPGGGQWQQQPVAAAPAAAPPAAPAAAAAPAGGVDPQLVAFLASKGVRVTPDMTQQTAEMIAKSFG